MAIFENTNLRQADLSSAFHFKIDPEMNQVKGAIVHQSSLSGFLSKHDLEIKIS